MTGKKTIALSLALCLTAGCAALPAGNGGGASPAPSVPLSSAPVSPQPEEDGEVMTCRIVDGAAEGTLLLAGQEEAWEVYTLTVGEDTPVTVDGAQAGADALADGMLVQVRWNGLVMESYPAQLGEVYALEADSGQTDDRCGLWLAVLEDLWAVDGGLNGGITQVGVDLSQVPDLTPAERGAVAWAFGTAHGVSAVTGTLEELWEQGYFTPMTQPEEGYPDSLALYEWEDGVHFAIDVDEEAVWSLPSLGEGEQPPVLVAFDAQKWRSGLGAYFFGDCVAQRGEDGSWSYTVGSEAIA